MPSNPLAKHADCKKVFIANSLAVTSVRLFGHFTTSDIVDLNKWTSPFVLLSMGCLLSTVVAFWLQRFRIHGFRTQ